MEGESAESTGGMREGAPEIPGFLSRGRFVSARIGNDLAGYVCDLDGNGLLLEVRDPSGGCTATSFCRGRASSGSAPKGRLSRGLRNATSLGARRLGRERPPSRYSILRSLSGDERAERQQSQNRCPSGGQPEGKRIDSVRGDVPYQGESIEPPDPESRKRPKPMTEGVDPS